MRLNRFKSLAEAEQVRIWRNSQLEVLRQAKPINKNQQIEYFQNKVFPEYQNTKPNQILYTIYDNSVMIGYGGFTNIAWNDKKAEVSFLLNSNIKEGCLDYCNFFEFFLKELKKKAVSKGFHRMYTETYEFREKHINVLERMGFMYEGKLRDNIYFDKKFINSILHGLLV
jgi:hypothetical protein